MCHSCVHLRLVLSNQWSIFANICIPCLRVFNGTQAQVLGMEDLHGFTMISIWWELSETMASLHLVSPHQIHSSNSIVAHKMFKYIQPRSVHSAFYFATHLVIVKHVARCHLAWATRLHSVSGSSKIEISRTVIRVITFLLGLAGKC